MNVDVAFRVNGSNIPADHGYLLYGAATTALPLLHRGGAEYAIHPIRGRQLTGRELALGPESELVFRLDHEKIPAILPLAGQSLRVGRYSIVVGVPHTRPLRAGAILYSRLVVIKGFTEADAFLAAAQRQVDGAGVSGTVSLVEPVHRRRFEGRSESGGGPVRRTLRVRDKEIVGFPVRVTGLSDANALVLQARGVGGRHHFGCGVLVPAREDG